MFLLLFRSVCGFVVYHYSLAFGGEGANSLKVVPSYSVIYTEADTAVQHTYSPHDLNSYGSCLVFEPFCSAGLHVYNNALLTELAGWWLILAIAVI